MFVSQEPNRTTATTAAATTTNKQTNQDIWRTMKFIVCYNQHRDDLDDSQHEGVVNKDPSGALHTRFSIPGINTPSAWVDVDRHPWQQRNDLEDSTSKHSDMLSTHSLPNLYRSSRHENNDNESDCQGSVLSTPIISTSRIRKPRKNRSKKRSKDQQKQKKQGEQTKKNHTKERREQTRATSERMIVNDVASDLYAAMQLLQRAKANAEAYGLPGEFVEMLW